MLCLTPGTPKKFGLFFEKRGEGSGPPTPPLSLRTLGAPRNPLHAWLPGVLTSGPSLGWGSYKKPGTPIFCTTLHGHAPPAPPASHSAYLTNPVLADGRRSAYDQTIRQLCCNEERPPATNRRLPVLDVAFPVYIPPKWR